jgi:hypothetical protein
MLCGCRPGGQGRQGCLVGRALGWLVAVESRFLSFTNVRWVGDMSKCSVGRRHETDPKFAESSKTSSSASTSILPLLTNVAGALAGPIRASDPRSLDRASVSRYSSASACAGGQLLSR